MIKQILEKINPIITEKNGPEEALKENPLTKEEVKKELIYLQKKYGTDLESDLGLSLIMPKEQMIGKVNVGGKTIEEVFDVLIRLLNDYEPPIVSTEKQIDTGVKEDLPGWLADHPELIWHVPEKRQLWKVVPGNNYQIDSQLMTSISYQLDQTTLKPGRSAEEQMIALDLADTTFNLAEWRVAEQIFKRYQSLEEDYNCDNEEKKEKAGEIIRSVLAEENQFRKGKISKPEKLQKIVLETINDVCKKTRAFDEKSINLEKLTQRLAECLSQLLILNHSGSLAKERIRKPKDGIKEIPSFALSLKELSRCAANQLGLKETQTATGTSEDLLADKAWTAETDIEKKFANAKGLTLMLGEAGTGKNEAVEYFAAKTKRPFFWFPCGRGMEAMDLVTHYEFDTKEGTKRFMTDLARGITIPGAVVLIDEVNALKPEVQAVLHGLGDSNRSLN
jgi:hypothetical protein